MPINDMQKTLQVYGGLISDNLESFFAEVPGLLKASLSEYSVEALDKLQEYSMRSSKRIRGSLVGFTYDYAAKTKYGELGIRAGVALELMQSYLLMIDDVMDKSELRRGQLTLHKLYLKEQAKSLQNEHIANMLAINVGIVAQHLANIVMVSVSEDPIRVRHATLLLHRNITLTALGQLDDLCQQLGTDIDEKDLIRKYSFKSSYYTFVNPIQIGLVLGGITDEAVLKEVERFGIAAGIAFQLHDDVIGVFGNAQKMGKSNLDDIKEGKYTLLMYHVLKNAKGQDVELLKSLVGNPKVTDKELVIVRHVLERNGSKKFVENKALWYARRAKDIINASEFWDEKSRMALQALVDYSVTREK